MKKNKIKKYGKPYSFRASAEIDDISKEIFGKQLTDICKDIADDISFLDPESVYNTRIFSNNQNLKILEKTLKRAESERLNLEQEIKEIKDIESELKQQIAEIQKENETYILNQRKYKEKSMNTIINNIMLLYLNDGIDNVKFDIGTVQDVINDAEKGAKTKFIIIKTLEYIDKNLYQKIEVVDYKSKNKKKQSFKLTEKRVKEISNVLEGVIYSK